MQVQTFRRILVCLMAAAVVPAHAQTVNLTYTVSGVVVLPHGTPAPRCYVTIYNDLGYSQEVSADAEGRFEITSVPRGRLFLRASNPDDKAQYSDPVPIDVGRIFSNRLFVSISLRRSDDP